MDIKELKFTAEVKSLLEEYKNLKLLGLNSCNMKSLEGFPQLEHLVVVELNDNQLTGDQLTHLSHLTKLEGLFLGGN